MRKELNCLIKVEIERSQKIEKKLMLKATRILDKIKHSSPFYRFLP
jgi:hypothetical protein